jgi:hypothetical protein
MPQKILKKDLDELDDKYHSLSSPLTNDEEKHSPQEVSSGLDDEFKEIKKDQKDDETTVLMVVSILK